MAATSLQSSLSPGQDHLPDTGLEEFETLAAGRTDGRAFSRAISLGLPAGLLRAMSAAWEGKCNDERTRLCGFASTADLLAALARFLLGTGQTPAGNNKTRTRLSQFGCRWAPKQTTALKTASLICRCGRNSGRGSCGCHLHRCKGPVSHLNDKRLKGRMEASIARTTGGCSALRALRCASPSNSGLKTMGALMCSKASARFESPTPGPNSGALRWTLRWKPGPVSLRG